MAKSKHLRNEKRTIKRNKATIYKGTISLKKAFNNMKGMHPKQILGRAALENFRIEGQIPLELPLDGSRLESIIKNQDSYIRALLEYSGTNLKKIEPKTDKQRVALQRFRVRGIFYFLDENNQPKFMLNYKKSNRTKNFFELSYKGGAEFYIDSDFYAAQNREMKEEMPDIQKHLTRNLIGSRGLFFNSKNKEYKNSDILVLKYENKDFQNFFIDTIITSITQVKKPFYPELTEHEFTLWENLENAQLLLQTSALGTGNDKDLILSKELIPNINLTSKLQKADNRYLKPVKDTPYIKLPESTAKLYKRKSNSLIYAKG